MSLDRSLKSANSLVRHRNVLTRDERLAKLKEMEKWTEGKSVFGLPKVAHRKLVVGGKAEKEDGTDAAAAAGATGAAPAGAAAAAPAKGGAQPAKGAAAPAKGAAPAKAGAASGAAAAPSKGKK